MKPYLNLGNAFIDAFGSRILNFQLCNERGHAVAIADYTDGERDRFLAAADLSPDDRNAFIRLTAGLASKEAVKSLEWAYPSSDNASVFGFPLTGCWIETLGLPGKPAHAVRSFGPDQFDWALSCVRALPYPWSPITLQVHPEYAESAV